MFIEILLLIVGMVLLIKGADLFVDGASAVAGNFKISKMLIGLTIVAFGTSAPEFAVSVKSLISGSGDIVLGNVVGSNIFNILLILGVSSSITPIVISPSLFIDIVFLIGVSILLGIFMFKGKKEKAYLGRIEGVILVLIYISYMAYIIFRN